MHFYDSNPELASSLWLRNTKSNKSQTHINT